MALSTLFFVYAVLALLFAVLAYLGERAAHVHIRDEQPLWHLLWRRLGLTPSTYRVPVPAWYIPVTRGLLRARFGAYACLTFGAIALADTAPLAVSLMLTLGLALAMLAGFNSLMSRQLSSWARLELVAGLGVGLAVASLAQDTGAPWLLLAGTGLLMLGTLEYNQRQLTLVLQD